MAAPVIAAYAAFSQTSAGKKVDKFVSENLKGVFNLVGTVSQDRFFVRYSTIRDAFVGAGYLKVPSPFHNEALDKFQIRKTQVDDHKKEYSAEFERLRQWVVYVLNASNPSLGDDYALLFPRFEMANQGQMQGAPVSALKEIIKFFKPNTYVKGGLTGQAISISPSVSSSSGNTGVSYNESIEEIQHVVEGSAEDVLNDIKNGKYGNVLPEFEKIGVKDLPARVPEKSDFSGLVILLLIVAVVGAATGLIPMKKN